MQEEFIVKGAMATCQFGVAPAMLNNILDNKNVYFNGKLAATSMSLGPCFPSPGFGTCNVVPNMPKPCVCAITKWDSPFNDIYINRIAHPLTKNSKGSCALSPAPMCISFSMTGQIPVPSMPAIAAPSTPIVHQSDMNPLATNDSTPNSKSGNGLGETEFTADYREGYEKNMPIKWAQGEFGEDDARYNCHFFAWSTEEDDPTSLGYEGFCKKYNISGDKKYSTDHPETNVQYPTQEMLDNYELLSADEPKQVGDRVIYFYDVNDDGKYNPELAEDGYNFEASHSGIVTKVVDGQVDEVVSKGGSGGVRYTHPAWPDDHFNQPYVEKDIEIPVSRAYYRRKAR